jgi:putative alpha-1,2-mannosidase
LAPARAQSRAEHITISIEHDVVSGSCVLYGVRWYFALITSSVGTGTPVLWNSESVAEREADRVKNGWCNATALAPGKQLERSAEECAATRFGVMWPTVDGKAVEIFVGLSQESTSKAVQYVGDAASCGFDGMHAHAQNTWQQYFDRVRITGGSAKTRRIFATAWYHAGLKPVRSERTNFLWSDDHELWSDLATMWDQYKTQLPYLLTVFPEHSQSLAESLLATSRVLGQFPNAVLFTPNLKKFENQSRLLAVVTLFDIYRHLSIKGTINYDTWRATAETMSKAVELESEKISPNKGEQAFSHLLDLSYAAGCVRTLSAELGLNELVAEMSRCEKRWREAFDPETGMMHKGSYYEGGNIHYSFRLLHDMGARIELCGGADAFNERLDEFFGFGADPVSQIGDGIEQQTGIELGRFDGLNNEIMLETPFAYHYIGKPDRTSQIIHAIQRYQWGDTAGGIPGNDDSGALSSWYFWNTVGLFPLSGQDIFFISTPLFDRVEIGSCGFVIEAERGDANTSDGSIYIESVELNGKLLDRSFLFLREVLEGGVLRLRLSRERGRFRPGRLPQDRIK